MGIWKEVLLPGRQRSPEGEWYRFGPGHIRRAYRNTVKMLSRGVSLPCVWEHVGVEAGDDDAKKAAYARHTFGHITAARINGRGALELEHEIPNADDVDTLRAVRFVSPKVYPGYSDSRGGEYRGTTIAHVAATPTPVQFWQRPFELSRGKPLYLSYTPEGRQMADENDDKPEGGKGGDKDKGGGDQGGLSKLIDALREAGMNVPDEVTDIPGLIIAVKASGGIGGGDDLDDDDGLIDAPGGGAAGGGAPMMMSDDRAKGYARKDKEDLVRRANRLFSTGRVTRPVRDKLVREIQAVQMSYTRAGDLHNPPKVIARLEAYEELPKNSAWKPTGDAREMSDTRGVDAPDLGGKDTKAVTDFMCAGLPAKK